MNNQAQQDRILKSANTFTLAIAILAAGSFLATKSALWFVLIKESFGFFSVPPVLLILALAGGFFLTQAAALFKISIDDLVQKTRERWTLYFLASCVLGVIVLGTMEEFKETFKAEIKMRSAVLMPEAN